MRTTISVKGARTNNLKNIDVEIPRDKLTIVTGVSGSGKTSLAFDVIFGEAQRRFFESMSASSRILLPMLERADVDSILGLSPVVAIQQRIGTQNPRSTVGTMTDISTYIRLLFSVLGEANCPYCDQKIQTKSANQIVDHLMSLPEGTKIEISAPVNKIYGEDYPYLIDDIRQKGYSKVRINGELKDITDEVLLDEDKKYHIEVLIDTFIIKKELYQQLAISIENARIVGNNFIRFELAQNQPVKEIEEELHTGFGCSQHHIMMHELLPGGFSPNLPEHACPTCSGVGTYLKAEPYLLIADGSKSINQGALSWYPKHWMHTLSQHFGLDLDTPFADLREDLKTQLFYGFKEPMEFLETSSWKSKRTHPYVGKKVRFIGIVNYIDRYYQNDRKRGERHEWYRRVMAEHTCPDCEGRKLRAQRLYVTVNGKNIYELGEYFIDDLLRFINNVGIPPQKQKAGEQILYELRKRIQLLIDIGLHYLRLNRRARTLSGGESQRVRLSTQLGSELMGMLYILDEPSIGLHHRDNHKIINILKRLRDTGNTVIVIEHDLETISHADHIIELGPGPGVHGGKVVVEGPYERILDNPRFLTGNYILGKKSIPRVLNPHNSNGKMLKIIDAHEHNLKNIDVEIPLGLFICITGVSGSGKSTLIEDVLGKALIHKLYDSRVQPGKHGRIEGIDNISDVRIVNQSPIGRTPRSTPASYVGIFDKIRHLFADLPESKKRGYRRAIHFSYNAVEGRCSECKGLGRMKVELQYMPDIETVCPVCKGARYNEEVLEIRYKGKNIGEILDMTVEEAMLFFKDVRLIHHKTQILDDLGLGYLKLGQPAPTLSGGESQRIKLAKELGKIKRLKDNLYIMDEPTVGLHMEDVQKLLTTINKLVEAGNTVIVIEHHLDVIKSADFLIDLGPEGGAEGGYVIAEGSVDDIIRVEESYTGQFLRRTLSQN